MPPEREEELEADCRTPQKGLDRLAPCCDHPAMIAAAASALMLSGYRDSFESVSVIQVAREVLEAAGNSAQRRY